MLTAMDQFVQRSRPSSSRSSPGASSSDPGTLEHHAAKRLKTEDTRDSDDDVASRKSDDDDLAGYFDHESKQENAKDESRPPRGTPFESSLPPVEMDQEAIEEYEALRASQVEKPDRTTLEPDTRKWVRGRSSIYVDAFNLALDTVLEDEAALFDDKEKEVFERWRQLGYEAQYL